MMQLKRKECLNELKNRFQRSYFLNTKLLEEIDKNLFFSFANKPKYKLDLILQAEKICSHRFTFLGIQSIDLGKKINWHKDFKANKDWPLKKYLKRELANFKNRDFRITWELSRFYHLFTLGKAFKITDNLRYFYEFKKEIEDWIETNPYSLGINWTCAMEVAIRAVNWILAYCFFSRYKLATDSKELNNFYLKFFKSLFSHGEFIMSHLENKGVKNNHYIADLVGLLYLGVFFKETKDGSYWLNFAIHELKKEIFRHSSQDGVTDEASIDYHLLLCEFFLSATILTSANYKFKDVNIKNLEVKFLQDRSKEVFGSGYLERLEKMLEFILYYTKPNGLSPNIGDGDDTRLYILSNYPNRNPRDHRNLLAVGGVFFSRDDFLSACDNNMEDAFWLLPIKSLSRQTNSLSLSSKAFQDSGVYIMHGNADYMFINCMHNGSGGRGFHAHNDKLSFELAIKGQDIFVDSGTFSYFLDRNERNSFRSTKAHNTLMLDNIEQNRFHKLDFFIIREDARPRCLEWKTENEEDVFLGEHYGYRRLKPGLIHKRKIVFKKQQYAWEIEDSFFENKNIYFKWLTLNSNKKERIINLYFHLSDNLDLVQIDNFNYQIINHYSKEVLASLSFRCIPNDISWVLIQEWGYISPSYGVKLRARILNLRVNMSGIKKITLKTEIKAAN